jgi:hypothetical protein
MLESKENSEPGKHTGQVHLNEEMLATTGAAVEHAMNMSTRVCQLASIHSEKLGVG